MRLILSLVFAFVVFSPVAYADTSVSGILSGSTVWTKENSPYVVNNTFIVNTGATLTIEPGVVVKMSPNYFFYIYGTLRAQGSSTDPIVFTSIKDDSVGGDTNGDGDMSTPASGDWLPLNFLYASKGELSYVNFQYGGHASGAQFNTGQIMTDGADLLISHGHFDSTFNYHLQQFSGSTTITTSEFSHAAVGIRIHSGTIDVSQSSFSDIQALGIFATPTLSPSNTQAHHNWWGDVSGPNDPVGNPSGIGVGISSNTAYTPWPGYDPLHDTPPSPGCTENCNSSVMFLPGFEASRLYRPDYNGGTDNLWEPNSNGDGEDLFLNSDGTSIRNDIYTKDVINSAFGFGPNIYASFIDQMNTLASTSLIHEWKAIPYDWRLSLQDILNNGTEVNGKIYYSGDLMIPGSKYIEHELERMASSSRTGKVTIIAHSNGGLLAKALLQALGDAKASQLVDKVILVASPQIGTPQAIGALLHGFDQGIPTDLFSPLFSESTARALGENSPGAYNLLPSAEYFNSVHDSSNPLVKFADDLTNVSNIARYGNVVGNITELNDFLLGKEGRVKPSVNNIITPNVLNTYILGLATSTHAVLDQWVPPTDIQVIQIAGWGVDTTSGIEYYEYNDGSFHYPYYRPIITEDGDGTVVVPSALVMGTSTSNISRYWVDLADYDSVITLERNHPDILEVPQLRGFIEGQILNSNTTTLPQFIYNTPRAGSVEKKLHYFLHSPLSLDLYDNQGNHTGISTTTGYIENNIPGAYYKRFGEVQYISAPASTVLHLHLDGQASGYFSLDIQEVEGQTITATSTFAHIPSSTSTIVTMDFTDGTIGGASPLRVDEDGNGAADITLLPKLNDIVNYVPVVPVILDTIAPTTTASTTGTLGKNGWYASNVIVALTATDTESGVASTTYSLDNGTTWLLYTAPVTIANEGTTTLLYRSVDKVGNIEATSTLIRKIDKTVPEASITFDPVTQKLKVIGIDNLSSTTVLSTASSSLITDDAGHTLNVLFGDLKPKAKPGRINIAITGLVYDGATTTVASTTLKYKWATTTPATTFKMFATYLTSTSSKVEAHYRPKKGVTIIMTTPVDFDDADTDDNVDLLPVRERLTGMVVPKITTNKGSIKITY